MKGAYVDVVEGLRERVYPLESRVVGWLARWSVTILRVGLGCVFLGFGLLKFVPGLSPAEELVMQTLDVLSFGIVPARIGVVMVAALECAIGLGLITGRLLPLALALLGFQMVGAMSPLVLFPGELFGGPFHAPTLEGQYVLKDVVLISAGLVIGASLERKRSAHEAEPAEPDPLAEVAAFGGSRVLTGETGSSASAVGRRS